MAAGSKALASSVMATAQHVHTQHVSTSEDIGEFRIVGGTRLPREATAMRSLLRRALLASIPLLLLGGCGGGGDGDSTPPPLSCSLADQKSWLKGYMDDQYFWYSLMPSVNAASYSSIDSYFDALLSPGGPITPPGQPASPYVFPADRWSYTQSTAEYDRFYGDGQTLGYG